MGRSIDQGPFELGTTRDTLGTTPEGDVHATNIVLQGLPKDIYKLINHNIEAKAIWDNVKMLLAGSELIKEDRESQLYDEFERFKMLPGHITRNCTQPKRLQNSDYFKDKMLLMQAQENGAVLDEEELLFLVGEQPNTFDADVDNQPVRDLTQNEDNIFQADECDAFDSDVDDEPTAQSIFMANLSSAGPTNLQAISSDASILSEVPDLEKANVANNVIPYERYMTINDVSVVPSCASSALNTAYVLIDNNVHTPNEPSVIELAIYKEQVAIYEQHAKFELTKREQRMDDQMRILIQDRNRMEENVESKIWTQLGYDKHGQVAQPTLYDGNEIINPDHDPTNVPSSEEDLELAELARQKMHEKMNDPVCVEKRIKYIPPNYSKENFLATFTPQTQLTPEQVFWSIDLEKRKAEELKANTPPLPVLPPATVLLPLGDQWPLTRNTPPKVLPTKKWKPTGRLLPLGRQCPLVRSTALKSDCMPADPQETIAPVVQIVLWYLDSGCSKHMIGDRSRLKNFVKKFIETVRFGNGHFGVIMGYGDYVIGDSVISKIYYVEGLRHNLFSVGQFCDSDLEVAFRKHTCFVRDLNGVDLIKGSRGTNLYTIYVEDMMRSSPICLLSKAYKNKSWLWHRRLNHLNFGTLNDLARKDLVRGLPRLKFENDHLFTWVKFLRSKDETLAFVINLLKQLQVGLNKTVRFVRTDNGTEFVNKDLTDYYESVGITHEKTIPRTPQQNSVVKRRNRTLVEAAKTMLIFSKAPLFLWAEAVVTAFLWDSIVGYAPNREGYLPPIRFGDYCFNCVDEYFETPTGDYQMTHDPAVPPPVIPTGPSSIYLLLITTLHQAILSPSILGSSIIFGETLTMYGDVLKNKARLVRKDIVKKKVLILKNPSPRSPDLKLSEYFLHDASKSIDSFINRREIDILKWRGKEEVYVSNQKASLTP
ncbi:retrovirus-related pol polyprotein from transposon TNT 1-94 [Tanacetum coccineum]